MTSSYGFGSPGLVAEGNFPSFEPSAFLPGPSVLEGSSFFWASTLAIGSAATAMNSTNTNARLYMDTPVDEESGRGVNLLRVFFVSRKSAMSQQIEKKRARCPLTSFAKAC